MSVRMQEACGRSSTRHISIQPASTYEVEKQREDTRFAASLYGCYSSAAACIMHHSSWPSRMRGAAFFGLHVLMIPVFTEVQELGPAWPNEKAFPFRELVCARPAERPWLLRREPLHFACARFRATPPSDSGIIPNSITLVVCWRCRILAASPTWLTFQQYVSCALFTFGGDVRGSLD